MIKKFLAISLNGKEKYAHQQSDASIFSYISMVSGVGESTDIKIFGENGDRKYLLCKIDGSQSKRVSFTMNEDNFHTIYCVGDGQVDLSGYSCVIRVEQSIQGQLSDEQSTQQKTTDPFFNDMFRALQPKQINDSQSEEVVLTRDEKRKQIKLQQ